MIESTLQIVIKCDYCDAEVETEEILGERRRPDVMMFEARAEQDASSDGWLIGYDGEHTCPDCKEAISPKGDQ